MRPRLAPAPEPRPVLGHREIVMGAGLAGVSGGALVAHVAGSLPMNITAYFVVLPAASILGGIMLAGRRQGPRLHEFSRRLTLGAVCGLAATLAYDGIRVFEVVAFGIDFDPFKAHGIFGQLMTGRPAGDSVAQVAGWTYHFWNGVNFGMMFAMVRPQGGAWWGLAWGLSLEWLMFAVYPSFLQVRLDNPGFLLTSMTGHAAYGLSLGGGLAWWHRRHGGMVRA